MLPAPMKKEASAKFSILVVERDEAVRGLIEHVLRRAKFGVVSACDAAAAAKLLACSTFDAVVRDASAGGVEGLSDAQMRRTIITTTLPERLPAAVASRAFAVLRMPFDVDEMVRLVRACAAPVNFDSVERFVAGAPALRRTLAGPAASTHELLLRSEMLRTIDALSSVLREAAEEETSRPKAVAYLVASEVAADLVRPAAGRGH